MSSIFSPRLASAAAAAAMCILLRDVAHAQDIQGAAPLRREVHGVVRDSAGGRPVAGVAVTVAGASLAASTDSAGAYRIAGSLPAIPVLTFRRIGYRAVTRRVDLRRGRAVLDVVLAPVARVLDGLTVRADSAAAFLRAEQASSTMSHEEIEQQRGQTLGETIKALPGVSVIQYGPSIAKPVVRGLHSQRIATINAGVPQEGQQWGGEHAPEIDAFAANEIEVIRGPGTILYGSGALGGVVRVTPRPLPSAGVLTGQVTTNAFSNNRQGAASVLLEGGRLPLPWLGHAGWRVQASARRAGDARTPSYYLPNTAFKELDFNAALGVARPWGSSEVDVSHFGTDLGLYVGAHVGNLDDLNRAMAQPFTSSRPSYTVARPDQRISHDMVAWRTSLALPRASRLEATYGVQDNLRREYDNHGFAVGARPAFALELFTHTLEIRYRHPAAGPVSGTIGVSGMRQGNLSPGRSFLIPQYRLYSGGVFGLEQVTLSRLTVTAGLRFDDRWQHAYQYGAPVVVSPDDRRNDAGLSGSLGASWTLGRAWSIAATAARAWRPANVNERFSQGVHHGTAQYEIGDSALAGEQSLNTDITLRHLGARTRIELSVFQNLINDYIFLNPREPISTVRGAYPAYTYAETDARLRGTELTVQYEPAPWLSLYANGNLLRGVDRATGNALYDMPADRLTASVRVTGGGFSRLTEPYLQLGATLVRQQDQVPPVTIYRLPTAGYALIDVELGAASIKVAGIRAQANLAVRNLLNRRYRDYLSRYRLFVDEPGRDVVLRLTLPFGDTR